MLLRRAYFLIVCFVLLESSLSWSIRFPRWVPMMSLVVVVFAALTDGPRSGVKCGLLLGLLLDLMSVEKFGAFSVACAVTGGAVGLLKSQVFSESLLAQLVIPVGAYIAVFAGMAALSMENDAWSLWALLERAARQPSLLLTLGLSPFLFFFFRKILRRPLAPSRYLFLQ